MYLCQTLLSPIYIYHFLLLLTFKLDITVVLILYVVL